MFSVAIIWPDFIYFPFTNRYSTNDDPHHFLEGHLPWPLWPENPDNPMPAKMCTRAPSCPVARCNTSICLRRRPPVFFPKLFFEYKRNPRPKSESALRKRPRVVSKLQARAIRYSGFFVGRFVRGSDRWRFLKDHSMFEHLVLAISYQSLHHFIKKKQKKHKIPTQTFLKPHNMLYRFSVISGEKVQKKPPTSGNENTFLSRWIFRLSLCSAIHRKPIQAIPFAQDISVQKTKKPPIFS